MIILEEHTKESLTLLMHKKVISLTDNLITLRTSPFGGKKMGGGSQSIKSIDANKDFKTHSFFLISSFLVVFKDNLAKRS